MSEVQADVLLCAICLCPLREPQTTDCSGVHLFCRECILRWCAQNPSCPLCRYLFLTITDVNTNELSFLRAPPPVYSDDQNSHGHSDSDVEDDIGDDGTELYEACVRCGQDVDAEDPYQQCRDCLTWYCYDCFGPFFYCLHCTLRDVSIRGVVNRIQHIPVSNWTGHARTNSTEEAQLLYSETLATTEILTRPIFGDVDQRRNMRRRLFVPMRILHERTHAAPLTRPLMSFQRQGFRQWYDDVTRNLAREVLNLLHANRIQLPLEQVTAAVGMRADSVRGDLLFP